MQAELDTNPFMRVSTAAVRAFVSDEVALSAGGGVEDDVAVLAAVRRRKDVFGVGSGKK